MLRGSPSWEGMSVSDFPWEAIYPYLDLNKTICRGILGEVVGTQGNGPYFEEAFDDFLVSCGIEIRPLTDPRFFPVAVLGRKDWSEQDLDPLLEGPFTRPRFYSQEMVIASMTIGRDIYEIYDDGSAVQDFLTGHPALEYVSGYQPPDSEDPWGAPPKPDEERDDAPELDDLEPVETMTVAFAADGDWPEVGPLGELGYRVGKVRGLPRHQRREILFRCFRIHLIATSTWTAQYIADWGQRCSQHRWERMCRALEWSITKAERTTARDMSVAIAEWQEDLQFLRENRLEWLTHSH
jgi:hypothetical protein